MVVRLVAEEVSPERESVFPHLGESAPVQTPPAPPPVKAPPRDIMEVQAQIARIMGFRLQLFAAFIGAAGANGYAVVQGSTPALIGAGLYNAMVFLPALWVAYKRG